MNKKNYQTAMLRLGRIVKYLAVQFRDCFPYPFLTPFAIHMNQELHNLLNQKETKMR